jgi:hypothetical protein
MERFAFGGNCVPQLGHTSGVVCAAAAAGWATSAGACS